MTRVCFCLLVVFGLIYLTVFSYLSVFRHLSLHSTYLDLGLESQVLWNTAQGRFFETSFGSEGQLISALSYHFTPVILLLAPLYRLFPSPIFLLILQTLVVSLGGLAVYLIALKVCKSFVLSLSLSLAYFLYPPLEYANLFDFHYITLATTLLLLAFYFLLLKKWKFFYLFLALAVTTKEDVALVSAFLGIYLIWYEKEKVRGIVVFVLSLIYFLAVLYILLPLFGGGGGALGRYDYLGSTPAAIIWRVLTHLLDDLKIIFMTAKIKYIFLILVSASFLPVLSPAQMLPALPEFWLNLFSAYNPQWQIKFHYMAAITPFVFIAAAYGLSRLNFFFSRLRFTTTLLHCNVVECGLALFIVTVSLLLNYLHSPSPLFYKFDASFYTSTVQTESAIRVLSSLTPNASVSAMNNLGPHLANRRFLFRFPVNYLTADFVALDPAEADNFDLSQMTALQFSGYLSGLIKSGKYRRIVNQPNLILFEKKI
ncbi:MAG: DUF2079 domain-containing protein [Patescibacteria group bacterium]|nr:DUF2079 domain-containing protein [Patescibacteria group bacterium]